MAILTQNRRRSTLGRWATIRVLPVPNNGIEAGDRAHVWIYRGLLASGSSGPFPELIEGKRIEEVPFPARRIPVDELGEEEIITLMGLGEDE